MNWLKSKFSWLDQSGSRTVSRLIELAEPRLGVLAVVAILVILVSISVGGSHEAVRNVGLIVGAIIALPIAIWRSRVAERQADIAQQSVLNERYQKSAEMLGSDVLSVRMGGIVALERLALEHPSQYHVEVMKLLFAFIRHPIEDLRIADRPVLDGRGGRQDVQAAVDAVRACRSKNRAAETNLILWIDLHGANLRQVDLTNIDLSVGPATDQREVVTGSVEVPNFRPVLSHADLSGSQLGLAKLAGCFCDHTDFTAADMRGAELSGAKFIHAKLMNASLAGADLSGAWFLFANLRNTWLMGTNLSGVEFKEESPGEAGLTQKQLDEACADPADPPKMDNMFDAETKEQLEWRGKECEKVFKLLDLDPLLWSP